jgi:SpoIID/LytB domain protein
MRYRYFVNVILILLGLSLHSYAEAAQYRDGQLFLEVLLSSGSHIGLVPEDGVAGQVSVSEQMSPISRTLKTDLDIRFANPATDNLWGFLNRSEPWQDGSDGVLREYFAWEDSCLVIKRENLVFEGTTFPDLDKARRYARETGIPDKQIQSIPITNATVKITSAESPDSYFETPLLIHSDAPLYIGGVKLGFSGDFILKAVGGSLVLTHLLPLEEYIAGVIQNEIGSNAPPEALKAQSVAARTHALGLLLYNRHTSDGYDLCNTTHCQVYKGKHLLNEVILAAVGETAGEVLVSEGKIADATYHSACGGKTDSSAAIWNGTPLPFLQGVTCIEAAQDLDLSQEASARRWISTPLDFPGMSSWERSALSWQTSISSQALARNVGLSWIERIVINKRGSSGRITDMSFYGSGTARLTSEYKIRQAFGGAKSSFFYINGPYTQARNGGTLIYPGSTIVLHGRGSGHGVGMCQVGALRMAREGSDYRSILSHYYPGTITYSDWNQYGKN